MPRRKTPPLLKEITPFTAKVMSCIHQIPIGQVATYKQIAELAGKPQGSRGVAWILHSCSTLYRLPWHRVLNSQGRISFSPRSSNFRLQKKRLEKEGVVFVDQDQLDLKKFQWSKKARGPSSKNQPRMFSK